MEIEEVAKSLKELGHTKRLRIYKKIVKAGLSGTPVGIIQEQLGIPGSTLSHHISSLVSAGLVFQRRESRTLYCVAEYGRLMGVLHFLQDECCHDDFTNPKEFCDSKCNIRDKN